MKRAAGLLVRKNRTVLSISRKPSKGGSLRDYGLPAGKVDPGETALQAALREAAEELDLSPDVIREEDCVVVYEGPDGPYLVTTYEVVGPSLARLSVQKSRINSEGSHIDWLDEATFLSQGSFQAYNRALFAALQAD